MIQYIPFSGLSANTSDYDSPDGSLSTLIGLTNEDGSLRPVLPPQTILSLGSGTQTITYIHKTSAYTHYILQNGLALSWIDEDAIDKDNPTAMPTQTAISITESYTEIYQVNSIGNTLIVLTDSGIQYILWKNGTYLYLGNHLPELSVSFGLQGKAVRSDEFKIDTSISNLRNGGWEGDFDDEDKNEITPQVLAKVNEFIAENSIKEGMFLYPFFVRYAYRLYDGSLTMQSAPVLMIASSDLTPVAFVKQYTLKDNKVEDMTLELFGVFHSLDYAVISNTEISNIQQWSDIIQSVDIFVSQPIYTYDQAGKCMGVYSVDRGRPTTHNIHCYSVCKHINQKISTSTHPLQYQKNTILRLYGTTFYDSTTNSVETPSLHLELPRKDENTIKGDIKNTSLFYLTESVKLEQLTTTRTMIDIPNDYLQSLSSKERITDDYYSHDNLIAKYAYTYNGRLNLANLSRKVAAGQRSDSLYCYSNGYVGLYSDATPNENNTVETVNIYFYIKEDKEIIVQCSAGTIGAESPILFLYYPNTNAYKAVITRSRYAGMVDYYEAPLENHAMLNGSFYFGGWSDLATTTSLRPVISNDRTVFMPSKIYTSEINNPFFFPLLGINTVGTGDILGIATTTRALSEGQFGQFPLYAFTTEGIWALEVSDTGLFSSVTPVTRDVCTNPEAILQTDTEVLFVTDRGIMALSGSQSACISDIIDNVETLHLANLPYLDNNILSSTGITSDFTVAPLKEYLKNCRMIYDYTNQRIIVFNPSTYNDALKTQKYTYAYLYSIKSKTWTMEQHNLVSVLNSYPEALAMARGTDGYELVNISTTHTDIDADHTTKGVIITRPLKLGDPDTLKTLNTLMHRGIFTKGHVKSILYGSRDLNNWHLISSSTNHRIRYIIGTPYKYFRLVTLYTLDKNESISGVTVEYTPRLTNKLR